MTHFSPKHVEPGLNIPEDDSGPSPDTCFDALALSLLLSRCLSVNVHAKRLPLTPTQCLLVTWYLRSP